MGAGVGVESSIVVKAFGVGWTVACMDRDGRKTSEETIRMVHFYKGQGTRKKKQLQPGRQTSRCQRTAPCLSDLGVLASLTRRRSFFFFFFLASGPRTTRSGREWNDTMTWERNEWHDWMTRRRVSEICCLSCLLPPLLSKCTLSNEGREIRLTHQHACKSQSMLTSLFCVVIPVTN